jgi:hypothetical protein
MKKPVKPSKPSKKFKIPKDTVVEQYEVKREKDSDRLFLVPQDSRYIYDFAVALHNDRVKAGIESEFEKDKDPIWRSPLNYISKCLKRIYEMDSASVHRLYELIDNDLSISGWSIFFDCQGVIVNVHKKKDADLLEKERLDCDALKEKYASKLLAYEVRLRDYENQCVLYEEWLKRDTLAQAKALRSNLEEEIRKIELEIKSQEEI